MPTSTLRSQDGRTITVEHEAGATPEQIKALARQQRPMAMAETVKPDTKGLVKPSAGGYLKQGLTNRAGDIAATTASAVLPGSGLLGLAGRTAASEVAGDATQAALGQKVTPGYHAAANLLGEGVAKVVGTALSPKTYGAFAQRSAKNIAEWLKDNVPAAQRFASDEKGLYDFVHGTGPRELSRAFDRVLTAIRPRAVGIEAQMPVADIQALGLKPTSIIQMPTAAAGPAPVQEIGTIDAGQALQAVTGLWKKNPGLYRRTVDALDGPLSSLGLGDTYRLARQEYKIGRGFIDFAEKGKFLYGERYEPVKAHEALDKHGKELTRRGLDELRDLVRGPGADPVKKITVSEARRTLPGVALGEGIGHHLGVPWWISGPAGGAMSRGVTPPVRYTGVPLTPTMEFAAKMGRAGAGEAVREGARDMGIPAGLPGYGGEQK